MALLDELLGGAPVAELDINDAEKSMESVGAPPPGVYHAMLEGAATKTFEKSGDRIQKLIFVIASGPQKGKKVEEDLWPPRPDDDEEKRKRKVNRNLMFAYRLGLYKKDGNGRPVKVEGKSDFSDCIGTMAFVNVDNREEEYTNKQGKKVKFTKAVLQFEGVLSPDNKLCKDVPVGKPMAVSSTTTGGSSGGTANGAGGNGTPKQRTFDDI